MKKLLFILLGVFYLQTNAQSTTIAEESFGISYTASTLSEGFDFGIGLVASQDFYSSGLGLGWMVQLSYLQPSEAMLDLIDYGYSFDVLLKYDLALAKGLQFAPTAGVGYFAIESDLDSDVEFYFAAGGAVSYFISNSFVLGLELTKPFLEGSNTSLAFSMRFNY
ncbi:MULTISPECIES: hypothetical protein [unclassified Polaribacter]|uniref:hypothetical protein n=1 Tax=unclassified Polaribacter TaxID=196858 RepID=UPI0011BFD1B9|nr:MULTISPECIES: hypothetical protein [unclassified Polaribacter]TXD53263.1 hypothetical protein ES043_04415 [Polaribacter sp. IC063]TXD60283.1 hypothetical protein ES044_08235 [Polaribacter sp. IC066]